MAIGWDGSALGSFCDSDDPDAPLLARERALAGAALLDPSARALLLAEVDEAAFVDPLATAVLNSLRWIDNDEEQTLDDRLHAASEPDLELVIEDLERLGDLEQLGGREAVEELVADRLELREARKALREAAARIGPIEEEAIVQLASVELNALEVGDQPHIDVTSRGA